MDDNDTRVAIETRGQSGQRIYWAVALAISFIVQALAALRGGYIGPDYPMHTARLVQWNQMFDWSATSPPTYYLLGHAVFLAIGSNNAFPITLSIIQAAVNAFALWWFFRYSESWFRFPKLHLALAVFLTFLPVRVIHAVSIGTDCTTIPMFVLLLYLVDALLRDETAILKRAAFVGLALTFAIACKYSFMAFLPALLVILVCHWWHRSLREFVAVVALCLVMPALFSAYTFWASSKVHGWNTEKHWLPKGMASDMNYRDLLTLKRDDLQLFRAPEYFKKQILASHKHSYLALAHLGIFTDTMNLFQKLSVAQRFDKILVPDQKVRQRWKTSVMIASMSLGVVWTLAALAGTAWTLATAVKRLFRDRLRAEDTLAVLATAFFLLMFLPIPFVYAGALFGYWTPRLILPALLYFFTAGFLLIDHKLVARWPRLTPVVLVFVCVQCAVEVVMLS